MVILELIKAYPKDSFVILVILIALTVFIVTSKKAQLKAAALYLVSVAENEWGSKTGQLKYDQVYAALKKELPIVTIFLSQNLMKTIIEAALVRLKKILADKAAAEEKEKLEVDYQAAKITAGK
jgi:type III secretory pathway component EscV